MAKRTAILFPKALRMLQQLGANIRLARLRRNVTAKLMAERAGISVVTLSQIERGAPTVAKGNYVQVLVALNLEKDILKVAAPLPPVPWTGRRHSPPHLPGGRLLP